MNAFYKSLSVLVAGATLIGCSPKKELVPHKIELNNIVYEITGSYVVDKKAFLDLETQVANLGTNPRSISGIMNSTGLTFVSVGTPGFSTKYCSWPSLDAPIVTVNGLQIPQSENNDPSYCTPEIKQLAEQGLWAAYNKLRSDNTIEDIQLINR